MQLIRIGPKYTTLAQQSALLNLAALLAVLREQLKDVIT